MFTSTKCRHIIMRQPIRKRLAEQRFVNRSITSILRWAKKEGGEKCNVSPSAHYTTQNSSVYGWQCTEEVITDTFKVISAPTKNILVTEKVITATKMILATNKLIWSTEEVITANLTVISAKTNVILAKH